MTQIALLPDGRLHLQHGPIDLLCQAWGTPANIRTAYMAAAEAFPSILPALCAERPALSKPVGWHAPSAFHHPIAQAMHQACLPHALNFLTPMAAVAGAIADHILAILKLAAPLQKAYVNNGGDIAYHLTPTHTLSCAVVTTLPTPTLDATLLLTAENPSRGIATSGRACKGQGGRSFSLGIADSVTVLASTAAIADAAATIIGNAVDLDHPLIQRRPAHDIDPDSDLGPTLVTWSVPPLIPAQIRTALDAGAGTADNLRRQGLIHAAFLALQGQVATCHQPELEAA